MIITNQVVKTTITEIRNNPVISETKSVINIQENNISPIIVETPVKPNIIQSAIKVSLVETPVQVSIPTGIKGDKGDKGEPGEPGSGINAEQIQGISVSDTTPLENQVLIYDGEQWTPAFLKEPSTIELTSEDISRGYTYLNSALGSVGEKEYITITPEGGPQQEYGKDYTVMNSDNNQYLILVWKSFTPVVGILSPVFPTEGMDDVLEVGDKIFIEYNKE